MVQLYMIGIIRVEKMRVTYLYYRDAVDPFTLPASTLKTFLPRNPPFTAVRVTRPLNDVIFVGISRVQTYLLRLRDNGRASENKCSCQAGHIYSYVQYIRQPICHVPRPPLHISFKRLNNFKRTLFLTTITRCARRSSSRPRADDEHYMRYIPGHIPKLIRVLGEGRYNGP
jgi:hypothetical protein